MKSKKRIFIITGITLLTLLIILPAILFSIINWGILPYKKLTPLVEREINKRIDGHFECEKIELTFFETYPRLGIKLVNGSLSSYVVNDSIASLLHFSQITATVRPLDYLFKKQITIGEVLLQNPHFHGHVTPDGQANWNIYAAPADSVNNNDSTTLPPIDLRNVRIEEGHFIYDNRQDDLYAEVEGFSLNLKGSLLEAGGNTFDLETGTKAFVFQSPSYTLKNRLSFNLKSAVELKDNFNTITLHGTEIRIDNLPFTADGSITRFPETDMIGINIETSLNASDMNDLIRFIPETYSKTIKDLTAKGSIRLEGTIVGELGENIIPTVDLCCIVENGSLRMKDIKQGIDELEMDMDLHIDGTNLDNSYASIEKLTINGLNSSLNLKGTVTGLMQSPAIEAYMKGNIDFTRIASDFLHSDTLLLQGNMVADLETSFRINDLLEGKYNNVKAIGKLDIDTLIAQSKPNDLDIFITNVHFAVDSVKSTSRFIAGDNLLNASLNIDSMNIRYKEDINTNISQLEMTAKTSPEIDTSAVISVTSHIRVDKLRSRLPDSTWVIARKAYLAGGIRPAASNKQIPNFIASITADSLRYFSIPMRTGASLTNSRFTVEALPYRDAMRQRREIRQRDTTRIAAVRDTTGRTNRRDSVRKRQSDIAPVDESSQFLRNWEVRGKASFNNARLFSRLFPLSMHMEKTEVKFDTNNITFTDAHFHAGESSFILTGELKSIRRAMLRGGTLNGEFLVASNYINCNELLQAMNKGMQYAEERTSSSETEMINSGGVVDMDVSEMQQTLTTASADSIEGVFIVPPSLDMSLKLDAKRIDYSALEMQNVEGEIVMRNQSINLKKLEMDSNIGHGDITMFYTAKDKEGASAGIDMEMQGILVDKLINLYPAIDSILPMLRSFEGVLDCQMSLTCGIDSTMSVVLPSINTACFLRGKNMVLLDGETFAEISKTLMFKNKMKNIIDSISVDLAVKNSKIEIFPFLLEMDRYRVAVGGTHNLDMTFNYHISVLKSPVPFKLGLDVTGDLDKPKFKITKCKYKNTFDPAKEQDLIAEKTNIREGIRALIRKQIIENAPELAANTPAPARTED